MSDANTELAPTVYQEFLNVVERVPTNGLQERPEVAGWLSVGLSFAASGITGSEDSLGSAVNGP